MINRLDICGKCPFYREHMCKIFGFETKYGNVCGDMTITSVMDKRQALKVLHAFQKWRRGSNIKMPPPCIIGDAIDVAIKTMRNEM